jgi:hypothetical protein
MGCGWYVACIEVYEFTPGVAVYCFHLLIPVGSLCPCLGSAVALHVSPSLNTLSYERLWDGVL